MLSLNGIKLSKPVVDSLCQLARDCCLSGLLLGHTNIGTVSNSSILRVRLQELSFINYIIPVFSCFTINASL